MDTRFDPWELDSLVQWSKTKVLLYSIPPRYWLTESWQISFHLYLKRILGKYGPYICRTQECGKLMIFTQWPGLWWEHWFSTSRLLLCSYWCSHYLHTYFSKVGCLFHQVFIWATMKQQMYSNGYLTGKEICMGFSIWKSK